MTGLDFIAAGVTLARQPDGLYLPAGPSDRADLLEDLRFEVLCRLELVGDGDSIPRHHQQAYHCDTCGDRIGHDKRRPDTPCPLCPDRCLRAATGLCMLCVLARSKALRERRKREEASK
jgi:DNA-directed RNA polymerase subunit RPC12/RpoP